MVRVKYKGGIGNQMFQHAYGRILAEIHGLELDAAPIEGFQNTGPLSGRVYDYDPITIGEDQQNCDTILQNTNPRAYFIYGFFQDVRYYAPYRDWCQKWFDHPDTVASIDDGDILVHIRRGDFFIDNNVVHLDYYLQLLEELDWTSIIIIGEGIDDKVRRTFRRFHPRYTDGNPAGDFKLFRACRRILCSNSSFSWWGAWLNDNDTWFPVPKRGYFSPSVRQRLRYERPGVRWVEGIPIERK